MILKNLDDFKKIIPTAVGIENFSDVEPYIQSAELWIKNQVLGANLYTLVCTEGFADNDLLRICQNVIGNHAYWDAVPFLDLVHTESGFAVISATSKVPASKERVERLRSQCLIRRDNEIELLITFLEEHPDYHDQWKGSPVYSLMSDCLIRTATELKQYGNWDGSRSDFLKLQPKLIQESMMKLEPIFSKDYIDELIEKQRDNDATTDDKKVIILLKFALGSLVNGNSTAAEKIAGDALRYMDAHLESFPTYITSGEYKARIAEGYINDLESPIFSSLF